MNYMLMPLRRYADFSGRSRRKEYWMWALLNLIVSGILFGALMALFFSAVGRVDDRGGVSYESSSSYDRDGDRRSRYSDETSFDSSERESRYDEGDSGFSSSRSDRDADYGSSMEIDPYMLYQEIGAIFWIVFALWMLWSLIALIPGLAVTVRRLHDTDKSGWMFLLVLIPVIGPLIILVFMLIEGTRGPNRYGPDPKGPPVDRTFA